MAEDGDGEEDGPWCFEFPIGQVRVARDFRLYSGLFPGDPDLPERDLRSPFFDGHDFSAPKPHSIGTEDKLIKEPNILIRESD